MLLASAKFHTHDSIVAIGRAQIRLCCNTNLNQKSTLIFTIDSTLLVVRDLRDSKTCSNSIVFKKCIQRQSDLRKYGHFGQAASKQQASRAS